jgi:type I restriction enzyme M protein
MSNVTAHRHDRRIETLKQEGISGMPANNTEIEKRLWAAADELRANSNLKSSEYSIPVLGLIFLRYADRKFSVAEQELKGKCTGRRTVGKTDYQARGVMYLPEKARFSNLIKLPEGADIGKAVNDAMKAIEDENEELKGILPRTYQNLDNSTLIELLRTFHSVPMDVEGDVFGKIYEYFLSEFASEEGSNAGEFFTPTSIVRLIVEIIEPFHFRWAERRSVRRSRQPADCLCLPRCAQSRPDAGVQTPLDTAQRQRGRCC